MSASQKTLEILLGKFKMESKLKCVANNLLQFLFSSLTHARTSHTHTSILFLSLCVCVCLHTSVENIIKKITACGSTNILLELHHQMKHYGKIMAIESEWQGAQSGSEEIPNEFILIEL